MGSHTRNVLTVKTIAASKAKKLRDGGGLWLVTKGRGRYWILDYRHAGRRRELGIGPLHSVGLADARQAAEEARALLRQGIDPIAHRRGVVAAESVKVKAAGKTFGEFADEYVDAAVKAGKWRGGKTEAGWRNSLGNHAATLRSMLPKDITTDDVIAVLEPLWGAKQETAKKLRERLEQVLDAAKVRGLRGGENPARWKGNLEHVFHKPEALTNGAHHAALPYGRLAAFMKHLRLRKGMGARALEFTILTAVRSGEARGARWAEIDFERQLWIVPAKRTKSGKRPNRVPLSSEAVQLLKSIPRFEGNDLVFPAPRGGELSDMTLAKVVKDMHAAELRAGHKGYVDPKELDGKGNPKIATPHGFRSSFKDWGTEISSHPRELVEMALSHAVGDAVERAYARGDALEKRRELMADWAAYIAK